MLILITTANFPDVMMPAYATKSIYSLYFIIYLMFGLFTLMNILLANVYLKFMSRFENLAQSYSEKRINMVKTLLDRYGTENSDFLSRKQAEEFFCHVFDLSYGRTGRSMMKTLRSILKTMDS